MPKQDNPIGSKGFAQELDALGIVLNALGPLEEDKRAFVFRTVAERLKILGVAKNGQPSGGTTTAGSVTGSSPDQGLEGVTPKEFLRLKKPISELQRMVCLAYYLSN